MKTKLPGLALLLGFSSAVAAAQSAVTRKDVPAIAKAAAGAIVTIITANNDKPIAQGSGFIVSADGVILTNYHVIETGNVAIVKFPDDTAFPVDGVLATDKARDLSIIKIHGKAFRTLALGDSDDIQIGEEVVAIGNPLLLESTVSNGIISGVRTSKDQGRKLLQTTAPISPGSSGGPLFNMRGEVVGINTLYLEGGENLNFAIPINEAKLLLARQSAKLQNLPNERGTDTPETETPKPDLSTRLPSEGASPTEKDSGVNALSHKTGKGDDSFSYYVRAYQNGSYSIEYEGRQILATCREALSWFDGPDKPGKPITEHNCIYIIHQLGKHIRAEQMWRGDKELRFEPSGHGKVADILDITAEAPIGAPLPRPLPKTSPEILKTLHWIQNTLAEGAGTTLIRDENLEKRVNLLPDVNGCQVTFAYATRVNLEDTYHGRQQVNLGDLDPTSLSASADLQDELGPVSLVMVNTTDNAPAVRLTVNDRSWQPAGATASSTNLLWELPAPYAARFAKALRRAITLCGGKPSAF